MMVYLKVGPKVDQKVVQMVLAMAGSMVALKVHSTVDRMVVW
jgi:hypothetical protein